VVEEDNRLSAAATRWGQRVVGASRSTSAEKEEEEKEKEKEKEKEEEEEWSDSRRNVLYIRLVHI
jgi:ribosomal protein L12E/L44/L45/RPP1/RPP2